MYRIVARTADGRRYAYGFSNKGQEAEFRELAAAEMIRYGITVVAFDLEKLAGIFPTYRVWTLL